jgi:hypothetical protein
MMSHRTGAHNLQFVRAFVTIILGTLAAACFMATAILTFAGLAAWSDYGSRGCPNGTQCSDAVSTMWVAGIIAPLAFFLAIGIALFLSKRNPWRAGRNA